MVRPFVEVDHSGDIGIEAHGASLGELIENLTRGLFSLMHRGNVTATVERRLAVQSNSYENLLVDWLSEVISVADVRGELYGAVVVERAGEHFVEAVLKGEKVDTEKHDLRFHVKAATYHGLIVDKRDNALHARVIFDL